MEMDFAQLMESGLPISRDEINNLSKPERHSILREVFSLPVADEPLLYLVNDFAHKHHLEEEYLDDGANLDVVRHFCGNHILSLLRPDKKTAYKIQRDKFKNDYHVLASIKDFNIEDPDQLWYLLLFCKKHVDRLTTKLSIMTPSVDEELNIMIDEIAKMEFNRDDWDSADPLNEGWLELHIDGGDKKISNHYTLHLLSKLIKQFLNKNHTEEEELILSNHFEMRSAKEKRWYYLDGKSSLTEEEEKELDSLSKDVIKGDDSILTEESNKFKKIALFKYFIIDYFNNPKEGRHNVEDYYDGHGAGIACIRNKWLLISKLITYIYSYGELWPLNKETLKNLYDKEKYLKDLLKFKEPELQDMQTPEGIKYFLRNISDKRYSGQK